MEHARKLVLLPRDSLERLQQLIGNNGFKSVQTPGTTIDRLDAEMSDILNSSESKKDDREKWDEYNRALQRFLLFNNNNNVDPKIDYPTENRSKEKEPKFKDVVKTDDSFIITGVPKTFKIAAANLIRHLKRCGNVTWTSKGAVSVNGRVLQGANIVDLVGDAMRDRKRDPPTGRRQFATALREAHVPREFIGNNRLWNEIIAESPSANSSSSSQSVILAHGFENQGDTNFVSVCDSKDESIASGSDSVIKNLSRRSKKNRKQAQKKSLVSGTPKKKTNNTSGIWNYLPTFHK